jgi:hypothetical protein
MPDRGGEAGGDCPVAFLPGIRRWGGLNRGVYFLILRGKVVYVGQAFSSVDARISSHACDQARPFDDAWWLPCHARDLNMIERFFIDLFDPPFNYDAITASRRGETTAQRREKKQQARECDRTGTFQGKLLEYGGVTMRQILSALEAAGLNEGGRP